MLRPTPEQLALLSPMERFTFEVTDGINRHPVLKRASHAFLRTAGAAWVYHCTRNILRAYDVENLTSLRPDRGVVMVSNHRSFFDMYVIASQLLRRTDWVRGMYFPVRSSYFYEGVSGLCVNAVMAGMSMYPPVMRHAGKRGFNQFTTEAVCDVAREPGTFVGYHPEGTRNRTDDPYTLLPASAGIGHIVHRARPVVLPAFILGLSNNLPRQVLGNFTGDAEPITLVFGKPMDLDALCAQPAEPGTYKQIADRIRDEITRLGALERAYRERDGLPSKAPPRVPPPVQATEGARASAGVRAATAVTSAGGQTAPGG